jgi:hypothetical protein
MLPFSWLQLESSVDGAVVGESPLAIGDSLEHRKTRQEHHEFDVTRMSGQRDDIFVRYHGGKAREKGAPLRGAEPAKQGEATG